MRESGSMEKLKHERKQVNGKTKKVDQWKN